MERLRYLGALHLVSGSPNNFLSVVNMHSVAYMTTDAHAGRRGQPPAVKSIICRRQCGDSNGVRQRVRPMKFALRPPVLLEH